MLILRNIRPSVWTHRSSASLRWFSDDEKFDKKEKAKIEKPKLKSAKSQQAANRLNSLLESMSNDKARANIKIQTAPKKKPAPKVELPEDKLKEVTAAIAKKIGGNVEQTESELLGKILGLQQARHEGSLSDLISGMKVDGDTGRREKRKEYRQDDEKQHTKADYVRKTLGPSRERYSQPKRTEIAPSSGSVDLFGSQRLGLFNKASDVKDQLETWSKLEQRELKLAVTHPPSNYFEKMILWTEQGKLWTFPIDNEQGLEEERESDFSEHVLLEMHLEDWCPTSGPVRHFMELVCVGLGKNYFLSAKEKKDHIMWYRQYFEEKKDLLGDLMLMGKEHQPKLEA